jgi:hypothetical protein
MVKKGTKKRATKKPRNFAKTDQFPLIEEALRKRTKADLIGIVMMMAKEHGTVARGLETRLAVEKPVDLLVADVSSAIDRATDFDEREINYNFDVDWQAYEDVQNGLQQLVDLECLEDAKSLAVKLMKDGSYQVESSDEGLMTDDIEDCLRPVIQAVKAAGGSDVDQWANKMRRADLVGFICEHELAELRNKS